MFENKIGKVFISSPSISLEFGPESGQGPTSSLLFPHTGASATLAAYS